MSQKSRYARFSCHALWVAGAALLLAACTGSPAPDAGPAPASPAPTEEGPTGPLPHTYVVWSPEGLGDIRAGLEEVPTVEDVVGLSWSLEWLERTTLGGRETARAPAGFAYPIEAVSTSPEEFAGFVRGEDARIVRGASGGAVLSETSWRLRDARRGMVLHLQDRRYKVLGRVSDETALGYEALLLGVPFESVGDNRIFYLVRGNASTDEAVVSYLERTLPEGSKFSVHGSDSVPFLRFADAVMPQAMFKERFGEFAARVEPDGSLTVEPSWQRKIVHAQVPVLGEIRCHRQFVRQMRGALSESVERGLDAHIDPAQYAGCYSPRFIGHSATSGQISHHAWGAAIDINSAENPFGADPQMDLGLVRLFAKWDLAWGGTWLTPDGMHFEWYPAQQRRATVSAGGD